MLKRGDIVKLETLRGNDGFAFRVTMEVTYPKQCSVKILQVVRFLGSLSLRVEKESFGHGIAGTFIVRGCKQDEEDPELGWIGMGADVYLSGGVVLRSVSTISINDSLIIFLPSNETIQ